MILLGFLQKGSSTEDYIIIIKWLNRKRKAPSDPSNAGVQTGTIEGSAVVGEVLVLSKPHHGLDVFCEKGILCPSSSRVSLLMNREYRRKVAQSIVPLPDR